MSIRQDREKKLADIALRMGRARRLRIDASRYLNGPWKGLDPATRTDSALEQARHDLSASRVEWRKASAALWFLVAKIERGEAPVLLTVIVTRAQLA